jgi:hypothetical protein
MPGGVNAPLALGKRLAQAAPNLARWVPVPRADNNDILESDAFIRELHTTLSAFAPKPGDGRKP